MHEAISYKTDQSVRGFGLSRWQGSSDEGSFNEGGPAGSTDDAHLVRGFWGITVQSE